MKTLSFAAILLVLAAGSSSNLIAKGKQAPPQKKEADLCVAPAGAQPLLPAKLLPGMGITKDFPVTTSSEEARTFFLQGVSQIAPLRGQWREEAALPDDSHVEIRHHFVHRKIEAMEDHEGTSIAQDKNRDRNGQNCETVRDWNSE